MKKIVIYGPQGSGKSRHAMNLARMHFNDDQILILTYDHFNQQQYRFRKGIHKIVVIDEYPECAMSPFSAFDYPDIQPEIVIVCIQRNRDIKWFSHDVTYIRMPDCVEFSVERMLSEKYNEMNVWIKRTACAFEKYSMVVHTCPSPEGDGQFEYSLVATRVENQQSVEG